MRTLMPVWDSSGESRLKGNFLEAPGAPEVQEVLADPLSLLRRPDPLDLLVLRRQDHLYRPLLPQDPEVLGALLALLAPETNRKHSTRASSPKPRATIFFA